MKCVEKGMDYWEKYGRRGREIGKRFDIYCRWRNVTICAVHLVLFWLLDMGWGPSSSFFHIISNKKRFNLQIMAAAILRKFSPVCNICKSQKKTLPLFIFLRRDNTIVLKLTGLQNKCAMVQIRRFAKFVIWDCKIPSPALLNLRPSTVHWQAFAISFYYLKKSIFELTFFGQFSTLFVPKNIRIYQGEKH